MTATNDEPLRKPDVTSDLRFSNDKLDDYNHFIHEPEELSALYDSRLHFPFISPVCDKMASSPTQVINDKVLNLTVDGDEKVDVLQGKNGAIERKQSLHSLDELESDLCKNKYCTDADVLNAVCVFSGSTSPVNSEVFDKGDTCECSFMISKIITEDV